MSNGVDVLSGRGEITSNALQSRVTSINGSGTSQRAAVATADDAPSKAQTNKASSNSPTRPSNGQSSKDNLQTEAATPKSLNATVKEVLNTKPEKGAKQVNSAAPNISKTIVKKSKPNNSIAGLHFNPGLFNLGNSCYLNSTLQGLMSTRLLENIVEFTIPPDFVGRLFPERSPALRNGRGPQRLRHVDGMEICMTFIRTLEHGWHLRDTTPARQRVSMNVRELRNRVGRKYDQYLDFQQQDAHEFLRHLLDCMYMEELDEIKRRQPPPVKRRRGQPAQDPPVQPIPENERLIPFVDQVFGGQLASMLICASCNHVSHTYEPFMDLSLSIRSEEDKESKRNRLKAFAQKFTRQAGKSVPRPLSTPPSPRKTTTELEPPVTLERRRSLELSDSRSDSDPDESKRATLAALTKSDDASSLRRVSIQLGPTKSRDRSRSREREESQNVESKSRQKAAQKAAYLKRIKAEIASPKSPLELLRSGLGSSGTPNGDSITAAAASWLRLGPTHGPHLLHCLKQFTAVESLEGDNMVGCSRCWKLANPTYVSRKRRNSASSSSSSDSDSDSENEPTRRPETKQPASIPSLARSEPLSSSAQESGTSLGGSSYQGPPIPSISTTSPLEPNGLLSSAQVPSHHAATSSSSTTSNYLTPVSSRHGSVGRSSSSAAADADVDSVSTASASDVSTRPKEVRLKTPSIPKSQRVMLRKAYKRYLIAVPPPVLVIHLKRFQQVTRMPVALFGSLKKIDDFIAFPEYLDLKPFIAPRREDFGLRPSKIKDNKGAYEDQVMYRLSAVVVHIGNMLGGHYVAYTALPPATPIDSASGEAPSDERRWSFQSDQIVRVATLEEVLSAKAYLCFYERVSEVPASVFAASSTSQSTSSRKR